MPVLPLSGPLRTRTGGHTRHCHQCIDACIGDGVLPAVLALLADTHTVRGAQLVCSIVVFDNADAPIALTQGREQDAASLVALPAHGQHFSYLGLSGFARIHRSAPAA
jgi:hypothetical protein